MGLVLRTQLTNTNGPGLVLKGSELTYAQGDSNFLFLLTNMSGSAISITGNTTIAGTLLVTGLITGTITNANNAISASYIRSTGVDGPHGMNSILSASYAVSSSYAPFAGSVFGGSTNYIPLWTSISSLSTSSIYQSGNNIGIGTTSPGANLQVSGTIRFPNLTQTSPLTNVVMYDQSTGQLYYTSSAIIAGTYSPGGSNTQIQYNNNGAFGGVPTLTYDGTTLIATGSFTGSLTGSLFGTASWAISASNAVSAAYAFSSSYALSASYASSSFRSVSSSFALIAFYASNAGSASYATFALSASYASSSTSASYASSSTSASYALSASYSLSSSQALSASYALSSSQANSSSYAVTAAYALSTAFPSLQQVTTVGSSSVDTIFVEGVRIRSGSSTDVTILDYTNGGGRLRLKTDSPSNWITNLKATNASADRNLKLPDGDGNLVLTVNGIPAGATGNVNIGTSGGGGLSGSGDPKYIAYWSSSTATLGDSMIYYDDINERIGVGTATPSGALSVSGTVYFHSLTEQSQTNFIAYNSASGQLYYFSTASWAYSASQAVSASFVSFALSSSYASSSTSASFANNSVSASYASSSTSASFATTASYTNFALSSSYASASTSASFATTASYANFALSSSYASSSTSASFATTASYANFALSASYASSSTSASFSTTSSYANFALSSSYASASTSASFALTASTTITSSYPIAVAGTTVYSTGPLSIASPSPQSNIFLGSGSGNTNTSESIFLGTRTGTNAINSKYSILIGYQVGYASNTGDSIGQSNIIIGNNVTVPAGTEKAINIGGILFGSGAFNGTGATPSSTPAGGNIGINVANPSYNLHASGTIAFPSLNTTTNITDVVMWSGSGQLFTTASAALRPDSASFATTASYTNFALSSSYASSSTSASFATTASFVLNAGTVANALENSFGISAFSYNGGSSGITVSVSGAINLTTNKITKWTGVAFANSSLTDNDTTITGTTSIQLSGASSILSGSFTGSLTGSLFGTSSWAQSSSIAITASYANFALSASYASSSTSASYASTASYIPTIKAGAAGAFGGSPRTASIIFDTPFPNNNYSISVIGIDARSWTINNKFTTGFDINSNSNVPFAGAVWWIAVPFNS